MSRLCKEIVSDKTIFCLYLALEAVRRGIMGRSGNVFGESLNFFD
jgi:hypothetical protein